MEDKAKLRLIRANRFDPYTKSRQTFNTKPQDFQSFIKRNEDSLDKETSLQLNEGESITAEQLDVNHLVNQSSITNEPMMLNSSASIATYKDSNLLKDNRYMSPMAARPYAVQNMTPIAQPNSDKMFGTQKRFFEIQPEFKAVV